MTRGDKRKDKEKAGQRNEVLMDLTVVADGQFNNHTCSSCNVTCSSFCSQSV